MTQTLELALKTSIFSKEKKLIIEPGFKKFGNNNFPKSEITAVRYGVKAIKGYRFTIGRIYCIDIKSEKGTIIKIRLKSLYRVKRILLGKKYKQIAEALFDNYVNDISRTHIEKFNKKIDFDLLGNTFTQDGIILTGKKEIISWIDLGTKNYWSYYSLFSIADPNKNKAFYDLLDWNTIVLFSVSRHILQSKKLL